MGGGQAAEPLMTGKRVIVIGGSSGIGLAIAQRLLHAGAAIQIVGADRARSDAALDQLRREDPGVSVHAFAADVRDEGALRAAFEHANGELGGLTTLIYAAGIGVAQRISATTESDWREIIDVNLTGAWRAARLGFPLLREAQGGSILTIGSDAGIQVERRLGAYSVSKAALIALTKELALDGAEARIRANCICPGYVEPGMRQFPDRTRDRSDAEPLPPLGRHGLAADVAAACLFLASDAAAFITGAVLTVDGGFTAGLAN